MNSHKNQQDDTAFQRGYPARSPQGAKNKPVAGDASTCPQKKATKKPIGRPTQGSGKWVKKGTRSASSSALVLSSVNDAISLERGNADAIRELKEEKENVAHQVPPVRAPPPRPPGFDQNSQIVLNWMACRPVPSFFELLNLSLSFISAKWAGRLAVVKKAYECVRPLLCGSLIRLASWLHDAKPLTLNEVTAQRNLGVHHFDWRPFVVGLALSQMRSSGPSGQRKVRSAYFQECNVVAPINDSRGFFAQSAKLSVVPTELTVFQTYRHGQNRRDVVDLVESAQTEVRHSLAPEAEVGSLVRQHVSRLLYSNVSPAHYANVQEDTSLFAVDRILSRRLESEGPVMVHHTVGPALAVFAVSIFATRMFPAKWRSVVGGCFAGVYEELLCTNFPWARLLIMATEHIAHGERQYNAPAHALLDQMPLSARIAIHVAHNLAVGLYNFPNSSLLSCSSLFLLGPILCSSGFFPMLYMFLSILKHSVLNWVCPPSVGVNANGYRLGEVALPVARPCSAAVKFFPNFDAPVAREPVQSQVGFALAEIAPPMPDPSDPPTVLVGSQHRFACDMPKPEKGLLLELQEFVSAYVRRHYDPIPPGELPTLEEWLSGTNYSEGRKVELRKAFLEANESVCRDDYGIKSFAKRETYMSYKHARGINSRSDVFKCFVGPAFSAIERVVYDSPCFIKHVPVKDRPRFLVERLGSYTGPWYESDYTSFEGSFSPEFMYHCEMVLYRYMLTNYPGVYHHIAKAMLGVNECKFKWFSISVRGRRMSGEMCTSLGNGFTNLMLALFCAQKSGVSIDIIVEGDDGLFCTNGPIDTSYLSRFGFDLKLITHHSILQSSFCGLQLTSELTSMTDPRKVLCNFGWSHSWQCFGGPRVKLGLFRAKSMSLLYEHPRCPILTTMALRGLELTSGVRAIFSTNWYEKQLESEVRSNVNWVYGEVRKGITLSMREEFSELYGIAVGEQIAIENEIRSWTIGSVRGSLALSVFGPEYADLFSYSDQYRI